LHISAKVRLSTLRESGRTKSHQDRNLHPSNDYEEVLHFPGFWLSRQTTQFLLLVSRKVSGFKPANKTWEVEYTKVERRNGIG